MLQLKYLGDQVADFCDLDKATRFILSKLIHNDLAGKLNISGGEKIDITVTFKRVYELIECKQKFSIFKDTEQILS